jgi:rod shape-determining protein MreC
MLARANKRVHQTIVSSSNSIAGGLYSQKRGVTDYLHLREMNDSLLKENQNLRKQLIQEIATIPIMDSTGSITYKRDTINKTLRYRFTAAKVIDNTFDEPNNYVTFNKGQYKGIKPGMAVLSGNSIVGVIKTVGPHYSVAKSIISQKNRVTAQLSDGTIGYLSWPEIDSRYAQLNDISLSKIVKPGDSVFTSLYSTTYPPGIFIGKIAAVVPSASANNFTIALATNFKRLQYAYIVEDITIEEIKAVQDSALAIDNPPKPTKK